MRWLRQTVAVMMLNLRTIPSRLGSSAVAIIGIASVVVVFVSVLSISAGFLRAMTGAGSPGRAPALRAGAETEMTSGIEGTETRGIKEARGIRHEGPNPLARADRSVLIALQKKCSRH